MEYSGIPVEWKQHLTGADKNAKLDYQTNLGNIDKELIRTKKPANIVTYDKIQQKTRTIPPGPIIKPQVNKNRGFSIDKTQKPPNMDVKDINKEIDMTLVPSFSTGVRLKKKESREYDLVTPKNIINNTHKDKPRPNIIDQLHGVSSVEPRKILRKTPMIDSAREITNYTPIHTINQPVIQLKRVK